MKRFMFTFLILLGGIVGIQAQKSLPDNFHLSKLSNGLEVLVIEDHSVPLATLELCVRNGAYTETDEYDGLSHLYEHMFFKANRDYPAQELFMEKVQEMGAQFNGTTSTNRVNYFITVTNPKLEEGLKFLNSAMRYPKFDKEEMKKENLVVDGEFERAESNPYFFLNQEMSKTLWGKHYSRKNTIGDHDIIKTATPEKMQIIKEKYYYPNNTLLAVAGDVDPAEVLKYAESIYGDWEPCDFDAFEKWPIPEFDPIKEDIRFIYENENTRQPFILMSWHGPDTRNDVKATYTADVFSYILSQKTSKLQQDLVDSGLAFAVNEYYQTDRYTGPIGIVIVPNPEKMEEAIKKIYEHIDMWDNDDYFTDEQLQTAKDLLKISDAYSQEKTSSFVNSVTYWWAVADIEYYVNYGENLDKVTREDIKAYVNRYIKGKPHATGIMVTKEMREQYKLDEFFKATK